MVFSRNPEREARLLDEWRKGTTAREAARKTGDPEGTVYYYWRKFNRDPEKANRLAASLKPQRKLNPVDIVFQRVALQTADEIDRKYDQLVKDGKIPQAEYYVRAERERRRLRREIVSDVNSITALYLADPEKHVALIPDVANEWVQMEMEKGATFLEAVERLENSLPVLFLFEHTKQHAALLGIAFETMKKDYLAKHASERKEHGEKTSTPEPPRPYKISDLFEPGTRNGPISKQPESFSELIESLAKSDEEELKRLTREATAKGQKVTVQEVTFRRAPTPQPPNSGLPGKPVDLDPKMKERLSKLHSEMFANRPSPRDMWDARRARSNGEPSKKKTSREPGSRSSDEKER